MLGDREGKEAKPTLHGVVNVPIQLFSRTHGLLGNPLGIDGLPLPLLSRI